MERTDRNGELRLKDVGRKVTLLGWVSTRRNLGSLLFIDLRDSSGIVQLIAEDPSKIPDVRNEYVVQAFGTVRKKDVPNPNLPTGEVEVVLDKLVVINKAETTVGYATLYGDCSGFFAPIADLWKHQVYALGRHLNEKVHGREIVPAAAFEIPPSAELGPDMDVEAGKGDPLVYPYHDFLFRWWTESEERPGPFASLSRFADGTLAARIGADPELVRRLFPDAASFVADLERWWRAFKGMGAVKRVQCPPLAAVSPWAFGSEREEAVLPLFFPSKYVELKNSLLRKR